MNSIFGGQKYEFSDNVHYAFPANASLKVAVERGDVKVSTSADDKLHIAVRKSLYAGSQEEAKKISDNTNLAITTVDNVVNVDASQHGDWKGGSIDLEILVPRKAALDIMTLRGALNVIGRDGDVKAHNSRGDVSLEDVNGNSTIHLRGGDFKAQPADVPLRSGVDAGADRPGRGAARRDQRAYGLRHAQRAADRLCVLHP